MLLSTLPISLLFPIFTLISPIRAQGQNFSFPGILSNALQNAGFIQLANITLTLNQSTEGQELLSQLSNGDNYTVFAPTDAAMLNISSDITSNSTLLAQYVSYHFIHGNFQNTSCSNMPSGGSGGGATSTTSQSSTESSSASSTSEPSATASAFEPTTEALFERLFGKVTTASSDGDLQIESGVWPNVTLGRTLLNSSDLVMLEGNKSQVLAWTRSGEDGNVTILNQIQNITVVNTTQYQNFFINGINGVLTPPGNLTTALRAVNATPLAAVLSLVQVPGTNGSNESAAEFLQEAQGFTLFAPNTAAFTSAINSTLEGFQGNQTAILTLLQNHYINGSTVYSPVIENIAANSSAGNLTSAAGEPLAFMQNDTGLFVEGANGTSAQIVRPDVLLSNGVLHVIDHVLFIEESNSSAASSAYESATSAAAISTTETAPIGFVPTSTTASVVGGPSSPVPSETSSAFTSSESSSASTSSESSSTSSESSASSTETASSTSSGGGGGGSESTASTVTVTSTPSAFRFDKRDSSDAHGLVVSVGSSILAVLLGALVVLV